MAIREFPTSTRPPSTTLDPDRLYELLERLLVVQERTVAALDRLTAPPPAAAGSSRSPTSGVTGRPVLRVIR
jgi:hypothetical protein